MKRKREGPHTPEISFSSIQITNKVERTKSERKKRRAVVEMGYEKEQGGEACRSITNIGCTSKTWPRPPRTDDYFL
jgi:hypothetical protein